MTDQATDTASAALLKLVEKWRSEVDGPRGLRPGTRRMHYAQGYADAEVACADELEAALASLPAPAAPLSDDFQRARAEKWLAAYERTKLRLDEVQALVLALKAHAKEHSWQDYDDPIADLLAWEAPAPAAPEEEKQG